MTIPTTFHAASAQAAAIPDTVAVELSNGGSAQLRRLSWLQFEALWNDLAQLLTALADSSATVPGRAPEDAASAEARATVESALAAAPQCVLRLAALSLRLAEAELAEWPPCDVLAVAAAALELNFIQPAGVRAFFASVARLGG